MADKTLTDYYEILQVNPKADQETIERVYRLLAKRYHPDNKDTGDSAKFESLVEAYHVLSSPEKRTSYDKSSRGNNGGHNGVSLTGPILRDREAEKRINHIILLTLYRARRKDVMNPGVGVVDLEKLLGIPQEQMGFHVWYLKEKGYINREEAGGFSITANGVDALTESDTLPNEDKLLPFDGFASHPKNDDLSNNFAESTSDKPTDRLSN